MNRSQCEPSPNLYLGDLGIGMSFISSVIAEQYWMCLYWKKHINCTS